MLNFTVYTRPACHLCNQLIEELHGFLSEHQLQATLKTINIDGNLALITAHGLRVPVLELDEYEVCFGRLDHAALIAAVNSRADATNV